MGAARGASTTGQVEDAAKSRPAPSSAHAFFVQQVGTADQVVEAPDAPLRHDLAPSSATKKCVDDMLGPAGELLAQHRVLRWPRPPGRC